MLGAEPIVIGRAETAGLQIDSAKVSHEHARIYCRAGKYYVEDLDSTNGTFVNGDPIATAELVDGDVVLVADAQFAYFGNPTDRRRQMATQHMTAAPRVARHSGSNQDLGQNRQAVLALRAAQAQLVSEKLEPALSQIDEHLAATPFGLIERPQQPVRLETAATHASLAVPARTTSQLRERSRWGA